MSKRKSVEIRKWYYEYEDEDGSETELFVDQKSVHRGQTYEDRMEEWIEGYLQALKDNGFKVVVINTSQEIV